MIPVSQRQRSQLSMSVLAAILLSLSSLITLVCAVSSPHPSDFLVHSISVNLELGGAHHKASQLHLIQQPQDSVRGSRYFIGLSAAEAASLSQSEVNIKFGPGINPEQRLTTLLRPQGSIAGSASEGADATVTHLYSIDLPAHFLEKSPQGIVTPNITISVDLLFHRLASPLPKTIGQTESVSLLWQGDSLPRTPYGAGKVRVKARAPTSKVHSYSLVPSFPDDTELISKSGSTITVGPQLNVQSILTSPEIQQLRIHYGYDAPIVSVVDLQRHVEVSHWGDNLAFQDRIWLRNDGPGLKGHFSRVEHQLGAYRNAASKNLLTDLPIILPSGARDAYFIDQIGNVSTSSFKGSPPNPAHVATAAYQLPAHEASYLHLHPRYPLMGGWNYTFEVGFNLPLSKGGWVRRSRQGKNQYTVAVPFWSAMRDVPATNVETSIVLPEGAIPLSVRVPFEADSIQYQTYTTYLDTIGRATVVIQKSRAGEAEAANVYITYQLGTAQHLLKPSVTTTVALLFFLGAMVVRRLQGTK